VEFIVTTADGKPAAAAKVKVHIAYGFGGFHKLDLEAGTNSDGRVKFTGLPSRVRRSELEFEASKDQKVGSATLDPAKECEAKREIKLGDKN
jgi:5-hydroxyisourate hydrolase-like protein (transthyretin family)